MKTMIRAAAIGLIALGSPAFAGVYTDDLSRCLVEKTTTEDKTALVQWIFVAMAQHPSVSALQKVTPADVKSYNSKAGALFTKLLTETCVETSKKAIKYEGAVAIQSAFQVLGQAAAGELFVHPDVTKVMSGLEEFLDTKKLEALGK
jgi:hypothetical protein